MGSGTRSKKRRETRSSKQSEVSKRYWGPKYASDDDENTENSPLSTPLKRHMRHTRPNNASRSSSQLEPSSSLHPPLSSLQNSTHARPDSTTTLLEPTRAQYGASKRALAESKAKNVTLQATSQELKRKVRNLSRAPRQKEAVAKGLASKCKGIWSGRCNLTARVTGTKVPIPQQKYRQWRIPWHVE